MFFRYMSFDVRINNKNNFKLKLNNHSLKYQSESHPLDVKYLEFEQKGNLFFDLIFDFDPGLIATYHSEIKTFGAFTIVRKPPYQMIRSITKTQKKTPMVYKTYLNHTMRTTNALSIFILSLFLTKERVMD